MEKESQQTKLVTAGQIALYIPNLIGKLKPKKAK